LEASSITLLSNFVIDRDFIREFRITAVPCTAAEWRLRAKPKPASGPDPWRTIIVERTALGWRFLRNNLHAVHHRHPTVPWSRLRALYPAHPGAVAGDERRLRGGGLRRVAA